jgi:hypothetical protein
VTGQNHTPEVTTKLTVTQNPLGKEKLEKGEMSL